MLSTHEWKTLQARGAWFRAGFERVDLTGRTALIVDDGIVTGAAVACRVARVLGAARVIVAAPVASPDAVARMRSNADEVICLATPAGFHSVGQYYRDFTQTADDEGVRLLTEARQRGAHD